MRDEFGTMENIVCWGGVLVAWLGVYSSFFEPLGISLNSLLCCWGSVDFSEVNSSFSMDAILCFSSSWETIWSVALMPSLDAAALSTLRIALAVKPFLPMRMATSSWATMSLKRMWLSLASATFS